MIVQESLKMPISVMVMGYWMADHPVQTLILLQALLSASMRIHSRHLAAYVPTNHEDQARCPLSMHPRCLWCLLAAPIQTPFHNRAPRFYRSVSDGQHLSLLVFQRLSRVPAPHKQHRHLSVFSAHVAGLKTIALPPRQIR